MRFMKSYKNAFERIDVTMRKLTALLMMIVLVFSLAACSNTSSDKENSTHGSVQQGAPQDSENNASELSDSSSPTKTNDGKTLVVYSSASGNTERVAKDIAEVTGADLFEIEPLKPYTDADLNWTNNDSRVSREHDDETLRNVPLKTTEVPDWDSYDTVFIGYPIWWGIAAWPVDNFVKENDFGGKTVIPFATSSSSGMGESGTLLEEMAGTGDWQEGHRFSSGASEEMVREWIAELNLNQ